jgi:tight adherence protein C
MNPETSAFVFEIGPYIVGFVLLVVVLALVGMMFAQPGRSKRTRSRISALAPPKEQIQQQVIVSTLEQLQTVGDWLASTPLIGAKEKGKMATTLTAAGLRDRRAVALLIAAKMGFLVLFPPIALGAASHFLDLTTFTELACLVGAAGVGWKLPDFAVSRYANIRRKRLETDFADALDLMVICVEAGLSLEQALDRVGREMQMTSLVVSQELNMTVGEMRVSPSIDVALYKFAKRADVQSIRSVVTTMIQSMQYGTPLAQSLRVLSAEMRSHKLLQLEEKAARLPVLMTVPLIIFILPCLFIVIGGPAVLHVIDLINGQ